MKKESLLPFLAGGGVVLAVVGALGGLSGPRPEAPPVYAQSGPGYASHFVAVTGHGVTDQHDLLYVLDTQAERLCVYDFASGALQLVAARNVRYDLQLDEFRAGSQHPSPLDIFRETEGKKDAGKPSGGPKEPPKKP